MFLTRSRKHSYFRSKTKHMQIICFGSKILHMSFKSCKLEQDCICDKWYHFHTRLISSPFENPQINMLTKKWYTLREYDAKHWIVTHWLILQSFQPSNLYWFVCFWPKNWSWPRLHKSDANYGIFRSWRFNERSMNVHLLLFVWEIQSCTRKQSLGCKTLFGYLRSIFSFTIPLRFNEECYLIGVFTYPIHLWCFHKLCFLGPITDITTSFFYKVLHVTVI